MSDEEIRARLVELQLRRSRLDLASGHVYSGLLEQRRAALDAEIAGLRAKLAAAVK